MDNLNEKSSAKDKENKKQPETSTDFDAELERILAGDWHTGTEPAKPAPLTETKRPAVAEKLAEAEKPAEVVTPVEAEKPVEAVKPAGTEKPAQPVIPELPIPAEKPQKTNIPKESAPILYQVPETDPLTAETPDLSAEEGDDPLEDEDDEPQQKRRPKRKSGYGLLGIPHILSTLIWLAMIVAIGVSFARVLWVCCADVMAFGKENKSVTITITEEDDIEDIAKKLGDAQLVRYPVLFKYFATLTGKDDNIGTGTFTLNSQLDYNAMINAMRNHGPQRQTVELVFPEGYNCAQIFKLLEENNVCTVADLEEYAANGELYDYWFLEGVPRGSKYCLEGYLSPDTYKFYTEDSPRRVLEKFLDEFEDRFTDLMKRDFEKMQQTYADRLRAKGFTADYIEKNKLTLHNVVTLASIIQKETSSNAECYDISSTFYNRLVNKDILTLGADATVYYALGDYFWEIDELTAEHLEVDSPYNTRKVQGIPPGPICNMGVYALYAALEPNETEYHYFVYDPKQGSHRFAVTYSEHLKNVAEVEAQ